MWLDHVTVFAVLVSGLFTPYVRDDTYLFDNPVGLGAVRGTVFENSLVGWYLIPLVILAGAGSFVVRYRGSSGVVRAQLKWFGVASGVVATGYLFLNATWVISWSDTVDIRALGFVVLILCFNAIPIASGFAILRYRL